MEKDSIDEKFYLKGYREGFESALKIAWACAEETLISVDNMAKPAVQDLIDKLKS